MQHTVAVERRMGLRVDAGDGVTSAARLFRYGSDVRLSFVMKVTLDWTSQGPAVWTAPEPIVVADERDRTLPGAPVRRASEIAITKSACDVTLVGRMRGAMRRGRLALFRQGVTLLDKSVAPDPIDGTPTGVGPIGADARDQIFSPRTRAAVDSEVPVLSPDFPWGWFQSAPRDQQVAFLEGDEWILLEGFTSDRADTRARLPLLCAHAVLWEPSGTTALPLSLDTLALDVDRFRASVLFRGVASLRGALSEAAIVARVACGGAPVIPHDLAATAARAPWQALATAVTVGGSRSSATMMAVAVPHASDAGAPFALASAGAPPGRSHPSATVPPSATGPISAPAPRSVAPWHEPRARITPAAGTARTVALDVADLVPPPTAVSPTSPWASSAPASQSAPPARSPWAGGGPVSVPSPIPFAPVPASPTRVAARDDDADDVDAVFEHRDVTPPSRAALTAAEMRNLGFAEEDVQRIMRTFRPAEVRAAASDGEAT